MCLPKGRIKSKSCGDSEVEHPFFLPGESNGGPLPELRGEGINLPDIEEIDPSLPFGRFPAARAATKACGSLCAKSP